MVSEETNKVRWKCSETVAVAKECSIAQWHACSRSQQQSWVTISPRFARLSSVLELDVFVNFAISCQSASNSVNKPEMTQTSCRHYGYNQETKKPRRAHLSAGRRKTYMSATQPRAFFDVRGVVHCEFLPWVGLWYQLLLLCSTAYVGEHSAEKSRTVVHRLLDSPTRQHSRSRCKFLSHNNTDIALQLLHLLVFCSLWPFLSVP